MWLQSQMEQRSCPMQRLSLLHPPDVIFRRHAGRLEMTMPNPADVTLIPELYSPMERAVLAAYLQIPDPRPDDLRGLDPTKPVPSRWSERSRGIGPQRSAVNSSRIVENAVARICLE